MSPLLQTLDLKTCLDHWQQQCPEAIALADPLQCISYAELPRAIEQRIQYLSQHQSQRVALALDNSVEWVLWDLALLFSQRVNIPVPPFFTPTQCQHLIHTAGIDTWIGAHGEAFGFQAQPLETGATPLFTAEPESRPMLPSGTVKVTFTSGSSGTPKGVCLNLQSMLKVARSLADIVHPTGVKRHLCGLPLATLLENIAGVYTPLLMGVQVDLPGLEAFGWQGASGFNVQVAAQCLSQYQPDSLILVPQLLAQMLHTPEFPGLHETRFVAVGGAKVSPSLLTKAWDKGWPVHEGYGLSEAASVVALNRPGADCAGSVGQLLPHVEARINESGELEVNGSLMLGYLGADSDTDLSESLSHKSSTATPMPEYWPTGDRAHFEGDHLIIDGRQGDIFITAYGRNVDPGWVESELTAEPEIAQAWVYGEACSSNTAIVVPNITVPNMTAPNVHPSPDQAAISAQSSTLGPLKEDIASAIKRVNLRLPDYAHIHDWRIAPPFTPENGLLTANGRLRRQPLTRHFADWLKAHDQTICDQATCDQTDFDQESHDDTL
ncbi:hypothetical protein BFW38_07165 [Terasakiispira papahanaumokuakeensis]|uniref:AMP-dependent synthetase/ligase domain-containing protein n=1 Tax=Terasakiispira papahanaumokuakeensis TaxID=197479 RepID=A0A1E2V8Q2_9GAMM|nr:AMP-binding protein [Terasakiispira papahanaumokuakeensis]ODC03361.1 hypothetical protein BFW38_07165 [Terasakiispira papahanaumokuakeensis]